MTSRSSQKFSALDPIKYLDLANELALRSEAEAMRTAADRSYYATFLFCRNQLAMKGYLIPSYSTEDHQDVSKVLKQVLKSRGNDEFRLRNQRNRVTYDTREVDYPSLQWMIDTATTIIKLVEALPIKST